MGKEGKMKRLSLLCCIFIGLLAFIQNASAIYTGQALVDRAKEYLGLSYELKYPRENNDGFGFVFNEGWENPPYTDCSGLVDIAAGLRRHYSCWHLVTYLTTPIGWEDLQAGDLLIWINPAGYDHVMIFEEWVETDTVKVVESRGGVGVQEQDYLIKDLKNQGYTCRRLIHDTTNPTIEIKGVEDGEVYNTSVTLKVEAEDDVYTDKSHPEPRRYAYEEDEENKFDEKTYSEDGEYTVNFKAIDWAKNEKDEKITFYIDRTPPNTSLSGSHWDIIETLILIVEII
jgi:hypothetical protein